MRRAIVSAVILSTGFAQSVWAAETDSGSTLTLELLPTRTPALRVDFDYRFDRAVPPFEREPDLKDEQVLRGLIPTVPPTPFIRNLTDKELYLDVDHDGDFLTGSPTTHTSVHGNHVKFLNLRVSAVQGPLVIPYTVTMVTYERVSSGWLMVQSGWSCEFELNGQRWVLGVVDNLDGLIDSQDYLYLRDRTRGRGRPLISVRPVPPILFFAGHAFDLGFEFKPHPVGVALEATLNEKRLPMGQLSIEAVGCTSVRLQNGDVAVVLDPSAGDISLPAGDFQIADSVLDYEPNRPIRPTFVRCERSVSVREGETASLRIGLPLRNTVAVSRDKNLLNLQYRLLGSAGEQYKYYDWKNRPRFKIYKGPLRIASGVLPFG